MGVKTLDELRKIRENSKSKVRLRSGEGGDGEDIGAEILVGMATCGIAAGARETLNAITGELARLGIDDVRVVPVGCVGYCNLEPIVMVNLPGEKPRAYGHVKKERVPALIHNQIVEKKPMEELLVNIDFDRA